MVLFSQTSARYVNNVLHQIHMYSMRCNVHRGQAPSLDPQPPAVPLESSGALANGKESQGKYLSHKHRFEYGKHQHQSSLTLTGQLSMYSSCPDSSTPRQRLYDQLSIVPVDRHLLLWVLLYQPAISVVPSFSFRCQQENQENKT